MGILRVRLYYKNTIRRLEEAHYVAVRPTLIQRADVLRIYISFGAGLTI